MQLECCKIEAKKQAPRQSRTGSPGPADTLAHMMEIAQRVDRKMRQALGCDGTNILINNGPASGQEIPHLHIHVIPRYENDGQSLGFTKTKYEGDEISKMGERLAL